MTMAIDPNVGHIVKFMEQELPSFGPLLKQLQVELDDKLNSLKLTLPELFQRIAIRLDLVEFFFIGMVTISLWFP